MPNQFFRISVSILCAVIGAAIDTGFLWTHSDNMQVCRGKEGEEAVGKTGEGGQ